LERVGKHGSKFDPEKAKWFNHQYIQKMPDAEIANYLTHDLEKRQLAFSEEYILGVTRLIKERIVLLPDIWLNAWFFFMAPEAYDEAVVTKIWNPSTAVSGMMRLLATEFSELGDWAHDPLSACIKDFVSRNGLKMGQIMSPLRLLVVGSNQGPGLLDIALLLGREEFLRRMKTGLEQLPI
jgi:glutamyl-tRNA synthetase